MAGMLFTIITFLAILGAGVCEGIAMRAPEYAVPQSGQTAVVNFKGQVRFVTSATAECCNATIWIAFGSAAGAVAASAALYFVFGRLPHE